MATIADVMQTKHHHVFTVSPSTTVLDAAKLMNEEHIGAVVVVDGEQVAGIFTERDVMRRIVARQLDPSTVAVCEVMTRDVACCTQDTRVDEARAVFKNHRIRHLPVIDERHRMAGMISIGDLNAYLASEQDTTIRFLHEYLYGAV
ncbi:MAG: inosine-5-monophosphate dehydrogenase [Phycisphaeraceae bacterium]|nr:inosine-5-monophosphate dehydrogenase [Phycisphaeraceae bacterium]